MAQQNSLNDAEELYSFLAQVNDNFSSLNAKGVTGTSNFSSLSTKASSFASSAAGDIANLKTSANSDHASLAADQSSLAADQTSLSNELGSIDINSEDISNAESFIKANGASINNVNAVAGGLKNSYTALSGKESNDSQSANTAIGSLSNSTNAGFNNLQADSLHGITLGDIKPNK